MSSDGGLHVRGARRGDLPSLVALSGSAERAEWRVRALERGDEALLVAELGGQLLGATSVRWKGTCDPPHPWLYGLHVRREVRRRGVGTLLVAAAEALARLHDVAAMSLDVDRDAVGLVDYYRRLGYEPVCPHEHEWRAVDPSTGAVTAHGTSDTWIMRHRFPTRGDAAAADDGA